MKRGKIKKKKKKKKKQHPSYPLLPAFWYMKKGLVPNSLGDWSKYEGARTKLSDNQIAQLEQLSEMSGIPFIQIISELIKEVLQQLTKIYPINFRVSHYDKVISLVTE